jgi:hypothetical protein
VARQNPRPRRSEKKEFIAMTYREYLSINPSPNFLSDDPASVFFDIAPAAFLMAVASGLPERACLHAARKVDPEDWPAILASPELAEAIDRRAQVLNDKRNVEELLEPTTQGPINGQN